MRDRALTLTLMIATLAAPAPAWASGEPCHCQAYWVYPTYGASNVPINARVLIFDPSRVAGSAALKDQNGNTVAIDLEPVKNGEGIWLVPQQLLQPNSSYTTSYIHGDSTYALTASFTTGASTDSTSPVLDPDPKIVGSRVGGECQMHYAARLTASGTDNVTPGNELLRRLVITGPDGKGVTLHVSLSSSMGYLGSSKGYFGKMSKEWGDCIPGYVKANLDDTFKATVAVMDWAGNTSAPSPELSFKFEYGEANITGCTCTGGGGGGGPSTAGAALLLGLWLWRRRRPHAA